MPLVGERPHNKYGSAFLIREDLKVNNVYERVQGTVELITIVMSGVVVHSVYKPSNDQFALPAFDHSDLPHTHIVIGDFNCHSTSLGYDTTDTTSHSSIMLNCRNPSTVQDGRKATTQISSFHLDASQTCVRSQS